MINFKDSYINKLCSGLFSDVLDMLGYKNQIITNFLKNKNLINCLGRARTLLIETVETKDENIKGGLSFISDIKKGEILIVKGSSEFAYFGELMTKLSTRQGIQGVVIDGLTRDTNYTHSENISLPILAKGYSPVDIKGRGRVADTDVIININGVEIRPNNLIYIDNEAICVIPLEIEDKVLEHVMIKLKDEERITALIEKGLPIKELLEQVKEF